MRYEGPKYAETKQESPTMKSFLQRPIARVSHGVAAPNSFQWTLHWNKPAGPTSVIYLLILLALAA